MWGVGAIAIAEFCPHIFRIMSLSYRVGFFVNIVEYNIEHVVARWKTIIIVERRPYSSSSPPITV